MLKSLPQDALQVDTLAFFKAFWSQHYTPSEALTLLVSHQTAVAEMLIETYGSALSEYVLSLVQSGASQRFLKRLTEENCQDFLYAE